MQDITSKEEQQARRQFSRLFCGEVMHLCSKEIAINDDSWNEVILDDIIHRVYPGNRLTTEKIRVLMTMLGWPFDALYFSMPQDKAIIEWIFPSVAEYISMASYIQFKQAEVPNPTQSAISFYKKFCTHNSNAAIRITTGDVYKLYLSWCYNTEREALTPKTFHTAFVKLGAVRNKGYCDGKSGVTFYLLKLNPEEVLNDEQQEDTPKETQQEESYSPKSLRDDNRPGITICEESVEGEASSVLPNEERQDTQPIDSGDGIGNEPDDQADAVVIARNEVAFRQQIPSTPENRDTIDHITQNFSDQFPALRDFAPAKPSEAGTNAVSNVQHTGSKPIQYPNDPTNIIGRLKQLPIGFRPTFDEIRICCKIAMDPFTLEQFTAMANDAGFHFTAEQQQELYDFLTEYAKADLRELKKGAIQ